MKIAGKRFLILGGAGLVGMAVCRELLRHEPAAIVVASIDEPSARDAVETLRGLFPESRCELQPAWGNLFVREEHKLASPGHLAYHAETRDLLLHDLYSALSEEILERSALYQMIRGAQPHAIVDCINTATLFAYQNIYQSATALRQMATEGRETLADEVELHLLRDPIPQLVRHIQILLEACRADAATGFAGVDSYVKVGTSGTGGMGLNIPFTHGEERPSRVLLSKAAVAGAHSLLLFLMGRTPDAPIIKEVKPTAAIAWKRIAHGKVLRRGKPIPLYDCPPDEPVALDGARARQGDFGTALGGALEATFVDAGENGLFSANEFKVLTSLGLMQFVTPEEIAQAVVYELRGGNTGHDVIAGLDSTVMGATYRAGALRHHAVERLDLLAGEHGRAVAAFEMLGPPRLSKLLYEGEILNEAFDGWRAILAATPDELSARAHEVVVQNETLRQAALSVGVPILLPSGDQMLRGPEIKTDSADEGWIDLTPGHLVCWQEWLHEMIAEAQRESITDGILSGSSMPRYFNSPGSWAIPEQLDVAEMVAWIFRTADQGARIKG